MRRHFVIKSRDADEANFHRFEGTVYVVDLATVTGLTEEFEGREWLVNRTKSGLPFGWDVEWQPDRHTDHDNPVALMKFADDTTALLIRTHHTRNWLPQSVIKALKSERCAKVGVGYGDIDKEKIRGTFNFYPSNVRDLSVVARRKGLAEQGLKALCEHFGYKPEKSARCARSDWSTDQLTNAQIQYAADDAYFLFILDDLLEALPDVAVDDAKGPEDLVDRGILQIREGLLEEGIVRKHDGLYCTTCGLGPWIHPDSVIGHLQGKKHVKKMETSRGTGAEVALRLQSERVHTACGFRALAATGLCKTPAQVVLPDNPRGPIQPAGFVHFRPQAFAMAHQNYGGMEQKVLLQKLKNKNEKKEHDEGRRCLVQGEQKWARGVTRITGNVKDTQSKYEDCFEEGYFYPLRDYLKIVRAHDSVLSLPLKEQVAYLAEMKVKVVKDKDGRVGVREKNMPDGAKYKYRVGARDETAFEEVTGFEDADSAEMAFGDLAGSGQQGEERDKVKEEESAAAASEKELFQNRCDVRARAWGGGLLESDASSAASAFTPRTRPRQSSETSSLAKLAKHSASQDIAHSLPPKQCDSLQLGPQQEKEKPPAAAAEEPAVAKRKNPGAMLRSSSSNEILEAGRMLLGQLQHFTPEELWEKQTRTRDVQMFVKRLQKGSTKAAGIADCPDAEACMLAGELLAASESVTARMEVLEHVRRKTTALLELDLPPAWQDEWSSFSRSLASSVLSYMANTAAAKLRPRDTSLSVSFLKFLHGGEVPGRITCGSGNKQIRATSHGTVQANGALSLVETLLANKSVEDLKAGVVALEPLLPVTSSMNVYTDEYLYSHPFWMPAAMVAFSFAVIACDVLELEKSTLGAAARRREPLLTEAVEALVRRKQELPLRLRVFNLRGKAEHMGKQAWVAMLKWVAENQSIAAEDVKPGLEAVEAPAAAAAPESCEPPAKKSKVKYGAAALKFLKS